MNNLERIKAVKAMEFLARQVNDEEVFDGWLLCGVPDGDIQYGDLNACNDDVEYLDYLISDETFSELMGLFLRVMSRANESGGLYCDRVVSE